MNLKTIFGIIHVPNAGQTVPPKKNEEQLPGFG
jgi:hypothetical protein